MATHGTPGRRDCDEILAAALAAGATTRQAARTANVSVRTVARRMAEAAFRKDVARLRAEMVDRAVGQLAASSTAAVGALTKLLAAENGHVRVAAARVLLDAGLKYREHVELAERVADLEARADSYGRATNAAD